MVDPSRIDDVLIELANRFIQDSSFTLTPKQAGRIIGQFGEELRRARTRPVEVAKEAASE